MNEILVKKSCDEFTQELYSKAPVPGGGGAAALAGALSASLCAMAGNLTLGKKKYADVEPDIQAMLIKAEQLRVRFLELVDEDAKAFEPLAKAYSMPKDTPDFDAIMMRATLNACRAPFEMIECACEAIDLIDEMQGKCSRLLISDAGCGAALARAALEAAAMNVFVNTKSLRGLREAEEIELKANALLEKYVPLAESISLKILNELRGKP